MKALSLTTATLAAGLMVGAAAHAAPINLFTDTFDRTASSTITGAVGQSGSLAPLSWVEQNYNGTAIVDNNGRLRLDATLTSGNDGALVFIDHNFVGLSSFEVRMDIINGNSGGNGRHLGFSVGQSKAELESITSASAGGNKGDFFIGYDLIGSSTGLLVRHNSASQGNIGSPTLSFPDTLSAKFTFADMDAGTTLNYEVFLNDVSVGTGSTAWSGTDENYIGIVSNYTSNSFVDNVVVNGELVPEPSSLALLGLGGLLIARRRRA